MKKFNSEICPVCGEGKWIPRNDGVHSFKFARKEYRVPGQHYAICDACESEGFLPGQRDENARKIREFEASIPEFISKSDVLEIREKYNLAQVDASRIFGASSKAFSKWERGVSYPAGPTVRLMKLALKFPEVMRELAAEVGLENLIKNEDKPKPTKAVRMVLELHPVARLEPIVDQDFESDQAIGAFDYLDYIENGEESVRGSLLC